MSDLDTIPIRGKCAKWKKSRAVDYYLRQRQSLEVITKYLIDPQGLLSKNQREQIHANSDLKIGCKYSLNKQRRWEHASPAVLAEMHPVTWSMGKDLDTYLARNEAYRYRDNITDMHRICSDGCITSVHNTGRMTTRAAMEFNLNGNPQWPPRKKNPKWKDVIIQPQLLYMIDGLFDNKGLYYNNFRTGVDHWWRHWLKKENPFAEIDAYRTENCDGARHVTDELILAETTAALLDELHLECDPEAKAYMSECLKLPTLGDFVVPNRRSQRRHDASHRKENVEKSSELLDAEDKPGESYRHPIPSGITATIEPIVISYLGTLYDFRLEVRHLSGVAPKWLNTTVVMFDLKDCRNIASASSFSAFVFIEFILDELRITVNSCTQVPWPEIPFFLKYSLRKDMRGLLSKMLEDIILHLDKLDADRRPDKLTGKARFRKYPQLFGRQHNSMLTAQNFFSNENGVAARNDPTGDCVWCHVALRGFEYLDLNLNVRVCHTCLRQTFYRQIEFRIPLQLPASQYSIHDLAIFMLPLPILKDYLDDMAPTALPDGFWTSCPHCRRALSIPEEDPSQGKPAIVCSECGIYFCPNCMSEPHFLMDCDEYRKWTAVLDDCYALAKFPTAAAIWRVNCVCGALVELCGDSPTAQCNHCRIAFSPRNIQLRASAKNILLEDGRCTEEQRNYSFEDGKFTVKLLNRSRVALATRYREKAIKSRNWLLDPVEQRNLLVKLRARNSRETSMMALEICKLGFVLVINGLGYLYLRKQEKRRVQMKRITALWERLQRFIENGDAGDYKVLRLQIMALFKHGL
ncbi:unnamed protein product, partial [Mesorhabditis spiculigera]